MSEKEKIIQMLPNENSQFPLYLTSHGRVLEYVAIKMKRMSDDVEATYELTDVTPDIESVKNRLCT